MSCMDRLFHDSIKNYLLSLCIMEGGPTPNILVSVLAFCEFSGKKITFCIMGITEITMRKFNTLR